MEQVTDLKIENFAIYIKKCSIENEVILNILENRSTIHFGKMYVITQSCSSEDYHALVKKKIFVHVIQNWWCEKELKAVLREISNICLIAFQINDFLRLLKLEKDVGRVILYVNNIKDIELLKDKNKDILNFYLSKLFLLKVFRQNAIYVTHQDREKLEKYFQIRMSDNYIESSSNFQGMLFNEKNKVWKFYVTKILYLYRKSMHYVQNVWFHLISPYGFVANFIFFPLYKGVKKMFMGKNEKRIKTLKGRFKGKRVFVVATGPSLQEEDVRKLREEYTIGVNISWKMFKKAGFKPTFFVITDPGVFDREYENPEFKLNELSKEMNFFNSMNKNKIKGEKSVCLKTCFLNHIYHYGSERFLKIADNIETGYYDLYSVTEDAISLAMYLGFSEIILIGADNDYLGKAQYFDETYVPYLSDYFYSKKCQKINNKTYEFIYKEASKRGISILNATRGGYVEAFPRKKLEDILGSVEKEGK